MDCCDDESCRNVRAGPFLLPERCGTIPRSSIDGRLQPVPLSDLTNVSPRPDRASRPAAAAVTGASQSDGLASKIPGIRKWETPEDKENHRAARVKGWSEKRQKGWSSNFTPEERELIERRFDAEEVLDAIARSPQCADIFGKEWCDVLTSCVTGIVDGSRKDKLQKNEACANVVQGTFCAAFDLCLNPLLESLGRSRISSPCALDATVEYLRQKLDPVNPTIIHGISVCARGGGGGEMLANHAGAPPQYSIIHRAFEEASPGAVFFDLPCNPFTCAPQACQTFHCMESSVGGKWFRTRFLLSWAVCCEKAYGLKIAAVALIGENSVLRYGSRNKIAEKLGVDASIITNVPHYYFIFKDGEMKADVLRFGVLQIQAVVADGLTDAEEREMDSLLEKGATGRKGKRKRKKREGAGPLMVLPGVAPESTKVAGPLVVLPGVAPESTKVAGPLVVLPGVVPESTKVDANGKKIVRRRHYTKPGSKGDRRAVCDGTVQCVECKTYETSSWHPGEYLDEVICEHCHNGGKVRTCWSHPRVLLHRVPPHLSSSCRLAPTTSAPGAAPSTRQTGPKPRDTCAASTASWLRRACGSAPSARSRRCVPTLHVLSDPITDSAFHL